MSLRHEYLFELKEDDEACRKAQQTGAFYLFHDLDPLLQASGHRYLVPRLSRAVTILIRTSTTSSGFNLSSRGENRPAIIELRLEGLLGKFGQDSQRIEDSVLIGCSNQQEAWFALDLGLKSASSARASLPRSEMGAELGGSFIKLRQAVFQLNSADSSLLFTDYKNSRPSTCCLAEGSLEPPSPQYWGYRRLHPEMAPVVITLVSDGARCLLARQSSFPKGLYSALAGFCDIAFAGESVEEAVQREVAEEVGLEVENIQYSASQHWPFPNSSLMIACHATVKPGHTEIQVNLKELEAAAWFGLDEVATALRRKGSFAQQQGEASPLLLPPKLAIAHHMIKKWVEKQSGSSLAA
ncbi:NAD(P)H pyrophosphatase NUDT13, mitochondrial [Apodemus speciosus]|uniref:NAD(+) diphosphatase n=1 Tax=Apodemus speciosus TaxID=105296 RepID=A0ABQ0FHR3_APOSI